MNDLLSSPRMDKTRLTVAGLTDVSDEQAFWQAKTPAERLQAVEFLRRVMYGYDPVTARLQRLLEVAQLRTGP